MSTATLSDRITATTLKPLDFATSEDAPQFIGAIVHAAANWWVNNACGPGIQTKFAESADLGAVNSEGTTLEELVGIRSRVVGS